MALPDWVEGEEDFDGTFYPDINLSYSNTCAACNVFSHCSGGPGSFCPFCGETLDRTKARKNEFDWPAEEGEAIDAELFNEGLMGLFAEGLLSLFAEGVPEYPASIRLLRE